MNCIHIIGNLTADPELRTTPNGINVATFTVAVNSRFKDANGNSKADFFRVSAWRQLGESCAKYLAKGKKVAVMGEVSAHAYKDKNGEPRAHIEVKANDVEFLTPRTDEPYPERKELADERSRSFDREQKAFAAEIEDAQFTEITDGDLPF